MAHDSDGRHAVSYYKFTCECGADLISESPVLTCHQCGRNITIEWRAVYNSPAPAPVAGLLRPWASAAVKLANSPAAASLLERKPGTL